MTQPALLERQPARLDSSRGALPRRPSSLPSDGGIVGLRTAGSRLPVFWVPTLGGSVDEVRNVVELLGPERPVYAVRPAAEEGGGSEPLDELAERCRESLAEHHPRGTVHLVGSGFGAPLAHEIARRLGEERLGSLVMIDPWAPSGGLPSGQSLVRGLLHFGGNLPVWLLANARDRGAGLPLELLAELLSSTRRHGLTRLPETERQAARRHLRAWRRHRPSRSDLTATILRTRATGLTRGVTPDAGWREILEVEEIRTLPGRPGEMLRGELVCSLAIQLRTLLDRSDRSLKRA